MSRQRHAGIKQPSRAVPGMSSGTHIGVGGSWKVSRIRPVNVEISRRYTLATHGHVVRFHQRRLIDRDISGDI